MTKDETSVRQVKRLFGQGIYSDIVPTNFEIALTDTFKKSRINVGGEYASVQAHALG